MVKEKQFFVKGKENAEYKAVKATVRTSCTVKKPAEKKSNLTENLNRSNFVRNEGNGERGFKTSEQNGENGNSGNGGKK